MQADEATVYDFTSELLRDGKVSDASYQRVVAAFGTRGAVELAALIGYYIMIAMTLLAHSCNSSSTMYDRAASRIAFSTDSAPPTLLS